MHLPKRTVLAFVLLFALSMVFWISTRPRNGKTPAVPNLAHPGHSHGHDQAPPEPVDMEPVMDFRDWLAAYRQGQRGDWFIEQGVQLAAARQPAMLQLIRQDPTAALGAALGYADYASLPREIQAWVEEPYTATGDVEVIAICDYDHHTPEYRVNVYLENNTRLRTAPNSPLRTGLSKLDVPLQGIRLEGWTAVRPSVFETLEGADVEWAWETLPSGNPDPSVDFFTGDPLGPNPVTAVAGGFAFLFSGAESLQTLEAELKAFDSMPGKYTGSSVIFSEIVQEFVLAKGFPIEQVRESQMQLSIEDTTGNKTSLFIRIVFPDKPDAPISKEDLEAQINGAVSGHLSDYSYNQTSMNATVTSSVYTASMNSAEYASTGNGDMMIDENDLWDEAVAAYKADGNPGDPFDNFDIVGISFPKIGGVGWAGLGTVGGANSKHWLNGVPSTGTILHEFGHNYGLNHSNYWVFDKTDTDSTDPVDTTGENEEYGDFWDVMGKGDENRGHFHMAAKRFLNWLGADQIQRIDAEGESGTYRVYRFDHENANTGLQGLEIRKAGDENYWIGFRRAYESNANYFRGAYILWERPPNGTDRNQGWIIDTTPGSDAERQDAGIALGRTYSDTAAGVHITPIAVGGSAPNEYLDVVVNYGNFPGNTDPMVSPSIPETGDARTPITLSAVGSDGDGDDLAYFWDLGNGDVYASSSSIDAVFTVGGTYDVSVTVSDMKGGTMTESAQIEISDPVNTWATRASGTVNDLHALAANGTHVVAAGKSTVLRSTDGENWSDVTPDGALNLAINGICWTGNEFIGVGRDWNFDVGGWGPVIYSSADGSSWSEIFAAPATAGSSLNAFNQVASNAGGTVVVAVGDLGQVYKRVNGGAWTQVDLGLSGQTSLGVAYGNEVFVVGGYAFGGGGLILFRSADTDNWENLKDNSDLEPWWGLDAVRFFNGFFLGSGFFSRTAFSENGGINWQSLQQGNTHEMDAFAFGNGVYYAIGKDLDNGNELVNLVSSNGKIWKEVGSGLAEAGNEILFFNNSFIIVGDDGLIRQSESIFLPLTGFGAWISAYFEDENAAASANPDFDWAENLIEWAVGSLPDDVDSAPDAPELSFDASGKAVFRIHRLSKSDEVTLTIEKSDDMKVWTTLATTATVDSDSLLELTSTVAIDTYPCFLRIKAVESL